MMRIARLGSDKTIAFAAEELRRYIALATGVEPELEIAEHPSADVLNVGLISDAPCAEMDDAIDIRVEELRGHISGVNPRSVLLAVYRYLTEIGCRWVRPGSDGEEIPSLGDLPPVRVAEAASYRHRGICIEGAVSFEHVRDLIDWMPKVGFNAYFTQFRDSYTFFDRWYSHEGNPKMEGRKISVEEAREIMAEVVDEIEKRDLIYHAVGHGWTCEPFGIRGLGWFPSDEPVPTEAVQYLAEIDGERKLFGGIALNTSLCYGNPEARRIMVQAVADYAEEHPEIDLLHLWLADGGNNQCECELCRDTRPSDFYVEILNEVDRALSAKGLQTRVVFLIYMDLLWAPIREKLENPDRFVLMFAPIMRTYGKPFVASGGPVTLPEYKRNKLEFPKSIEGNVEFLRQWQRSFGGDGFDFDYHLMWAHYGDPGYMQIAELLHEDIRGLKKIDLNGYVSCQVQRAFFPTGLPMVVMGRTLWDSELSYESIASDYFSASFGPDGGLCMEYLKDLSDLFDPDYLRREKPRLNPSSAESFGRIPGVIEGFMPVISRNLDAGSECRRKSWLYIRHHAELCILLAGMLERIASGDDRSAKTAWERVRTYLMESEPILHPVLDFYIFEATLSRLVGSQAEA
jgi:hypothetical protein